MSAFTDAEIEYLRNQRLGRLATVGPDGQPHIAPVTFVYNPDEDAIDVGGQAFGSTKKWRDATADPHVTFLVDDVVVGPPRVARAIEIRGTAELHETGGDAINPRFPRFDPHYLRIRPTRIVAWGIEEGGVDGRDFGQNARDVG
jgi:pyridoxamine 5'-phosphate oxidase family protein